MKTLLNRIISRLYYFTLPIRESGGYRIISNQRFKELEGWTKEAQEAQSEKDYSPEWEN